MLPKKTLSIILLFLNLIGLNSAICQRLLFSDARDGTLANYLRFQDLVNQLKDNPEFSALFSESFQVEVLYDQRSIQFLKDDILVFNIYALNQYLYREALEFKKAGNPIEIYVDLDVANSVFFESKKIQPLKYSFMMELVHKFAKDDLNFIASSPEVAEVVKGLIQEVKKDSLNKVVVLPHLEGLYYSEFKPLINSSMSDLKGVLRNSENFQKVLWVEQYNEQGQAGTVRFLQAVDEMNSKLGPNEKKILPIIALHPHSDLFAYQSELKTNLIDLSKHQTIPFWKLSLEIPQGTGQAITTIWVQSGSKIKTAELIPQVDDVLSMTSTAADVAYAFGFSVSYPGQIRQNLKTNITKDSVLEMLQKIKEYRQQAPTQKVNQERLDLISSKVFNDWCKLFFKGKIFLKTTP